MLDRLGNRLGFDQVVALRPRESFLPEYAVETVPAAAGDGDVPWRPGPIRPLRLLTRPELLETLAAVPDDGPPAAFRWRRVQHRLQAAEGPERIAPGMVAARSRLGRRRARLLAGRGRDGPPFLAVPRSASPAGRYVAMVPARVVRMMAPDYAELQVTTNFSFLRGASHAHELVARAVELGHTAIAVADRNSLAGVVRMHIAAKDADLPLLVGARLDLIDGASLLAFPEDRAAYGRLSRLITVGRRRAPKGECELTRADVFEHGAGIVFVALPPEESEEPDDLDNRFAAELSALAAAFPGACYLAGQNLLRGDDTQRLAWLAEIAGACGVSLVATNDVHMHEASRRPLADVLICIREHCTIDDAGYRLAANGERHLKSAENMLRLFEAYPDAVARTQEIVQRCRFNLDELRYEYPDEVTGDSRTPQEELIYQTWEGAKGRYPGGVPKAVRTVVEHELDLIGQLGYAPYFLTVYDIVRFARERHILCQGRGSAANSAVCYCLGITAVDPS